jgi:Flp pilus assembly pilin Flp
MLWCARQTACAMMNNLRNDSRGAAATEYVIILGIVGLGSAVSFIAVGVAFLKNFALVRNLLLVPFP